jgi:hypothetical protein
MFTIHSRARLSASVLLAALAVTSTGFAHAQVSQPNPAYTVSVDSVLSRFEHHIRAGGGNNIGLSWVIQNLRNPVPKPRVDSLLNGLERFALTNGHERVRNLASQLFLMAGERDSPRPVHGLVPRIERIYRANPPGGVVRFTIRHQMPQQADRRAAAALLRSIAVEPGSDPGPDPDDMGNPRIEALAGLRRMGAEGRAVLQAMHRSGEARDPRVKTILQDMARAGFPVREPERTP